MKSQLHSTFELEDTVRLEEGALVLKQDGSSGVGLSPNGSKTKQNILRLSPKFQRDLEVRLSLSHYDP